MTTLPSVRHLGGNQYAVTIGDETRHIDLDGSICVTDDAYNTHEALFDEVGEDYIFAPMHGTDEWDTAAIQYVAGYTDVDGLIDRLIA